jgi:muramoyltetrapeptide carboxypeptidase
MSRKAKSTLTPDEVLDDYFGTLPQPSMAGFPFGHITDPLTLPYGVLAELDTERGKLTILESATVRR